MVSLRTAQTGKRVYNGFSQSPNRGQVSSKGVNGYIQRELRKKAQGPMRPIGRDGKSDRRSQIAAKALRNQGRPVVNGPKQPFQNGGRPINPPIGKQPFQNQGRPVIGPGGKKPFINQGRPIMNGPRPPFGNTGGKQPYQNDGRPTHGGNRPPPGGPPNTEPRPHGGPRKPGGRPNTDPRPPGGGGPPGQGPTGWPTGGGGPRGNQIRINQAGVLELPYNGKYSRAIYNAVDDANQQLLGLKVDADQQGLQYQAARRDADLQYGTQKAQTLNTNAAGGTAFSSMYGTGVTRDAGQYANQVGQLDSQNTAYQQNLALQRATIQNALNQQIQLGAHDNATQLSGLAGTLGFGNQQAQLNRGKKRKKRKNMDREKLAQRWLKENRMF